MIELGQTELMENAQAEIAHLKATVQELETQTAFSRKEAKMQTRREMLRTLYDTKGPDACHVCPLTTTTPGQASVPTIHNVDHAIALPADADSGNAALLLEAEDDYLLSRLLEAHNQVAFLARECGRLRTSKFLHENVTQTSDQTCNVEIQGKPSLKQQLVALTEQLNDAKLEIQRLQTEINTTEASTDSSNTLLQQATAQILTLKNSMAQDIFPDASAAALCSQIEELKNGKETLMNRVKMLEQQMAAAKERERVMQRVLHDEREMHSNTRVIEDLKATVIFPCCPKCTCFITVA